MALQVIGCTRRASYFFLPQFQSSIY
jgi:hypothetical protein